MDGLISPYAMVRVAFEVRQVLPTAISTLTCVVGRYGAGLSHGPCNGYERHVIVNVDGGGVILGLIEAAADTVLVQNSGGPTNDHTTLATSLDYTV